MPQAIESFFDTIDDPIIRSRLILKRFPLGDHADRRSPPATRLMLTARIVVITYFDTPFLEALAANVPLIAFWDRDLYGVTPAVHDMLDEMATAGIFHRDPLSAAITLERVYPVADAWWRRGDVQQARLRFLESYGQSRHWANRWTPYLRGIAGGDS
jgi:putative transferase (TIGR04331 family)